MWGFGIQTIETTNTPTPTMQATSSVEKEINTWTSLSKNLYRSFKMIGSKIESWDLTASEAAVSAGLSAAMPLTPDQPNSPNLYA